MSTLTVAGHELQFSDCRETGQAGPTTCTLSIDGEPVVRRFLWWSSEPLRFHQSPLEYNGDILVPMWALTSFYLVRINPRTLTLKRLSRGFGFMRLLRVAGDEAEFSTWWDDREKHIVKLA
ncbi:hypothetical protein G7077_12675 [Sphingomonas piscis]|uniref:Uncharacterized protein n=1 Tax=Sphingomonas piscis TaxID=2714943 RepID=A0A6G7YSC0_9SPHN|nr:hypothetical protein [Sphingomonas piscis]QIK79632.1 hypothetical protein G7077_12675 [Sphingomonas piscis]